MAAISSLSPEWKEWVLQNLSGGCSLDSIAEVMIENETHRFSHEGNFIKTSDRKVRIVSRFDKPCIAVVDDLFSKKECTLDRRISEVMNWPIENGEGLQILNYKVGAEYRPHFDYFSEDESGSKHHLGKGGQRVSTLVVYLCNVEAGGETTFPAIGLTIKPKIGSAVYFEYCNSLGQVDPLTLHGGAPVLKGEKWIVTKWKRQGKYT